MNLVDELFAEANAVGTGDVSRAFELGETDAREWADELGVAKIGASFAWTRTDVEALAERLDAEDDDDADDDADDDDDDDGDDDDDDEGQDDDDDDDAEKDDDDDDA